MITDELRKYSSGFAGMLGVTTAATTTDVKDDLEEIADRIDQEHEECEGFCRRLEDAASKGEEVTLFGTDYMPLPKGADGVTIHVGDTVVDWETPRPVAAVSKDSICLSGYEYDSYYRMGIAKNYRHHHVPTVEDVLRNVVTLCHNTWKEESPSHFYDVDDVMKSGNIAEYAAKLRLAGEDA